MSVSGRGRIVKMKYQSSACTCAIIDSGEAFRFGLARLLFLDKLGWLEEVCFNRLLIFFGELAELLLLIKFVGRRPNKNVNFLGFR